MDRSVSLRYTNPLQPKGLRADAAGVKVEKPKGYTVKQPELTSLLGLRDNDGDQLHLVRLDRANGSRGYLMAVGRERVLLTAGDLHRLSTVIRDEIGHGNDLMAEIRRFFAQAILLLILCALVWLITFEVTPLWMYPWSD